MWKINNVPKQNEKIFHEKKDRNIEKNKIVALEKYWFNILEKEYQIEDRLLESYADIIYIQYIFGIDYTFGSILQRMELEKVHGNSNILLEEGIERQYKVIKSLKRLKKLKG